MGAPAFNAWSASGFGAALVKLCPPTCDCPSPGKSPHLMGAAWPTTEITPELLAEWSAGTWNVGLRTSKFPALDIDVDDPALVTEIEVVAARVLGVTAKRTRSNSPRSALLYRREGEPFRKRIVAFTTPAGVSAKVEMLADGQQIAIAGTHNTGAPLEWTAGQPVAADLATIDGSSADALIGAIRARLTELGCAVGSVSADSGPAGEVEHKDPEPHRLAEVRGWLRCIDPDCDGETWRKIIQAIHGGLGPTEEAHALAHEWSSGALAGTDCAAYSTPGRSNGMTGARRLDQIWASSGRYDGHRAHLGTIQFHAELAGYTGPTDEERAQVAIAAFDGVEVPAASPEDEERAAVAAIPFYTATFGTGRHTHEEVVKSAGNIALFFLNHPKWKGRLRWNERKGPELDGNPLKDEEYSKLGDEVMTALGWPAPAAANHVSDGIMRAARELSYDPITDWLKGLKWDGACRLDTWLITAGVEDSKLARIVGRRWLIGAAGRGLHEAQPGSGPEYHPTNDEGTKHDTLLILEGDQGANKSTLFSALTPPGYFLDSVFSFDRSGLKDLYQALGSNFIVEMAELDALRRAEVSTIKAVISSRSDKYRKPYGRVTEAQPRKSVLAGTSNQCQWIQDTTGARRFWPVSCKRKLDASWVRANRDQLWAEAVHAYRAGEVYWEDEELKALLQPAHAARQDLPGWAPLIEAFLSEAAAKQIPAFTQLQLLGAHPALERHRLNDVAGVLRYFGATGPERVWTKGGGVKRAWLCPGKAADDPAVKAYCAEHLSDTFLPPGYTYTPADPEPQPAEPGPAPADEVEP